MLKELWVTVLIVVGILLLMAIIISVGIFLIKSWEHINSATESLESLKTAIVERDIQQCTFMSDQNITWTVDDINKLPKGYYRNCIIKFYAVEKKPEK